MKLQTTASGGYPKFNAIGDKHGGAFVRFDTGIQGKFGTEDVLVLQSEGRALHVRCPAMLSRTLQENIKLLVPGRHVELEYVADIPTTKGNPAKQIDVDVDIDGPLEPITVSVADPKKPAEPVAAQTDATDDMPF
jgi:hypothetical protein